jgi:hypothetical protein
MVFADTPAGATNVTVAVVALVAFAKTDVGAAIYVCIAVADAFVELVAVVAITLNVYAVLAVKPVTVNVVPLRSYDPPPLKSYEMVFAEPPVGAVNLTVAVVELVALAKTDVGAAIYVFIAIADAFVELVAEVAITLNVYAVLAVNPVTKNVVPLRSYDPPPLKS